MKPRTPQTNGALAKARKVRELSVKSYYANPNFCTFCKKCIEIGENDIPSQIRLKKYCNHRCYSAHQVGRKRERRQRLIKEKICKNCQANFLVKKRNPDRFEQKEFCDNCRHLSRATVHNYTKAELFSKSKNWQSARGSVRKNAVSVFKRTKQSLVCIICGYTNHVEIAHITSVSEFADKTLISKINDSSNLVALCPNHHWEFDNGYFSIISII